MESILLLVLHAIAVAWINAWRRSVMVPAWKRFGYKMDVIEKLPLRDQIWKPIGYGLLLIGEQEIPDLQTEEMHERINQTFPNGDGEEKFSNLLRGNVRIIVADWIHERKFDCMR